MCIISSECGVKLNSGENLSFIFIIFLSFFFFNFKFHKIPSVFFFDKESKISSNNKFSIRINAEVGVFHITNLRLVLNDNIIKPIVLHLRKT